MIWDDSRRSQAMRNRAMASMRAAAVGRSMNSRGVPTVWSVSVVPRAVMLVDQFAALLSSTSAVSASTAGLKYSKESRCKSLSLAAVCGLDPGRKLLGPHGMHPEVHIRKSLTAVVR